MLLSEQTGTKETRGSCTVFYSDVASEGGRWCFFSILPPAWPVKWCLLLQYRRVEISSERAFLLCSTHFSRDFSTFFHYFLHNIVCTRECFIIVIVGKYCFSFKKDFTAIVKHRGLVLSPCVKIQGRRKL